MCDMYRFYLYTHILTYYIITSMNIPTNQLSNFALLKNSPYQCFLQQIHCNKPPMDGSLVLDPNGGCTEAKGSSGTCPGELQAGCVGCATHGGPGGLADGPRV